MNNNKGDAFELILKLIMIIALWVLIGWVVYQFWGKVGVVIEIIFLLFINILSLNKNKKP